MHTIGMPKLSDSMTEGVIVRWLVRDGERVSRGDELAEIETDKATIAFEAEGTGTLRITAPEGTAVAVGAPIGYLLADGEAAPSDPASPDTASPDTAVLDPATPDTAVLDPATSDTAVLDTAAPDSAARGLAAPETAAPATAVSDPAVPGPHVTGLPRSTGTSRVKASPLARRLAAELGVDLAALRGTGPGGRVVKADVQTAATDAAPPAPPAEPIPASNGRTANEIPTPANIRGTVHSHQLTRAQAVVAARMTEAKTAPEFTVSMVVDMAPVAALREQLRANTPRPTPSVNDFVVRAAALAMREHPKVNAAYHDGAIEQYERVNVGVAVAGPDSLVVPTVLDADTRSLGTIAADIRALTTAARDGRLTPAQLDGATFTVSNLGMFGVQDFTAVLNPPQAAILAVGAVQDVPVVSDGAVTVGSRMTMTLTSDHRVLYGADAARFLAAVRDLLQQPLSLLL